MMPEHVLELDRDGARHDGARPEREADLAARIHADQLGLLQADILVGVRAGPLRTGRLDAPQRIGLARSVALPEGLDDHALRGDILRPVVLHGHLHHGHRVVRLGDGIHAQRGDTGRIRAGTRLGEQAPAIVIPVVLGIVGEAGRRSRILEAVLPPVLDHVVIGEHLAQIELADLQEVVRHLLTLARKGAGGLRIKPAELEPVTDHVLRVVGELIAVRIVLRTLVKQAVDLLPRVRQAIAVAVNALRVERGVDGTVGEHAQRQIAEIGLRGGNHLAVVVQEGRRIHLLRSAVRLGNHFPPVRQAVAVQIGTGLVPRIGRPAVPHLLRALREGAAQRNQVARADEAGPQVELVLGIQSLYGGHDVRARRQVAEAFHVVETLLAVVPERVRVGRVREQERGEAAARRRLHAGEVRAPVLRIQRGTIVNRQMADKVLDARQDLVLRVHRAVDGEVAPPADFQIDRLAVDADIVRHALREACRLRNHVDFVDGARHRREVVDLEEFGRHAIVAARTVNPLVEDRIAVSLDVGQRVTAGNIVADVHAGTGAVPDANFVHVTLEEGPERIPRRLVGGGKRTHIERLRTHEHRAGNGGVAVLKTRAGVAGLLQTDVHTVRRNHRHAVRMRGGGVLVIQVQRQRGAIERERDMHPLAFDQHLLESHMSHAAVDGPALELTIEVGLAVGVELDADAEVPTDRRNVVRERRRIVVGHALQDDLLARDILGADPSLDRELLQHVVLVGVRTELRAHEGRQRAVLPREPHRLAAVRITEVQGIRGGHDLLRLFSGVAREVAIRVVAFVLFERELEGTRLALADKPLDPQGVAIPQLAQVGIGTPSRVQLVVLRHEAGTVQPAAALLRRAVGHPQRGRVRMRGGRRDVVHEERLVRVADAIAIGVALGRTDHPRILHRIELVGTGLVESLLVPTRPRVVPGRNLLAIDIRDAVVNQVAHARDAHGRRQIAGGRIGRAAQQRVQTVEQLIVVVHAVVIRVPLARIRRGVASGHRPPAHVVQRRRRQHDAVARLAVVVACQALGALGQSIPGLRRTGEVAQTRVVEVRSSLVAGLQAGLLERFAIPRLHRDEADERHVLLDARLVPVEVAAHQRRLGIVVTEVTQALHQVFLVVLQTIMVPIRVTVGARHIVLDPHAVGILAPGAVHTAGDVVAAHHLAFGKAIGNMHRLHVARFQRNVDGHAVLIEDHAGELPFPGIRQQVLVRIDRARVETAAAEARGVHVFQVRVVLAIDKRDLHLVRSVERTADIERRIGRGAFEPIDEVVAIRILVQRVGREELVPPALRHTRMVLVDRRDVRVGIAGVNARELVHRRQEVVIEDVEVLIRPRPVLRESRVEIDIELPAIRDAVAVRVGAMDVILPAVDHDRGLLLVLARGRVLLRERRRRLRACVHDDFGHRLGARLELGRILSRRAMGRERNRNAPRVRGGHDVVAVGDQEIFVTRRVRHGVHREPRVALGRLLPAGGHVARVVLVPRRTRVESGLLVDLMVQVADLGVRLVRDDVQDLLNRHAHLVEFLIHPGAVDHARHPDAIGIGTIPEQLEAAHEAGRFGERLLGGIVAHFDNLHAGCQRGLGTEEVRRLLVRTGVDRLPAVVIAQCEVGVVHQDRLLEREVDSRLRTAFKRLHRPDRLRLDVRARREGDAALEHRHAELATLGGRNDRVFDLAVHAGHEVAVGVLPAVLLVQRIRAGHDFVVVAHAVAIGVPTARIRAEGVLLLVGEAIAVEVVLKFGAGNQRVERRDDFLGRDGRALARIHRVVARTRQAHPLAVPDNAHAGEVPEEVLETVIQAIAVRVRDGRVRRTFDVPAAAALLPLALQPRQRAVDVGRGRDQVVRARTPGLLRRDIGAHERVRLGLGEPRIGRDTVLDAVQAVAQTADFKLGRERLALPPAGLLGIQRVRAKGGRQPVVVAIVLADIHHLGGLGLGTSSRTTALFSLTGQRRQLVVGGVEIRDGVLVDVAHVVRLVPFEGEEDFNPGRRVGFRIVLVVGELEHLVRDTDARIDERRAGRETALVNRVQNPAEEEAVLLLGVGIGIGRRALEDATTSRDAETFAAVQRLVVDIADAVAVGLDAGLVDTFRERPRLEEVVDLRTGIIDGPHAALAQAALATGLLDVGLREVALATTVLAIAERALRPNCKRLARGNREELLRDDGGTAVLVLHLHADPLAGTGRRELVRIDARRLMRADDRVGTFRVHDRHNQTIAGEDVVLRDFLHVPADDLLLRQRRHVDVRVGGIGQDDFRRNVRDVDREVRRGEIEIAVADAIGILRLRDHLGRDPVALVRTHLGTVEVLQVEAALGDAAREVELVGAQARRRIVAIVCAVAGHFELDLHRGVRSQRQADVDHALVAVLRFREDLAAVTGRELDRRRIHDIDVELVLRPELHRAQVVQVLVLQLDRHALATAVDEGVGNLDLVRGADDIRREAGAVIERPLRREGAVREIGIDLAIRRHVREDLADTHRGLAGHDQLAVRVQLGLPDAAHVDRVHAGHDVRDEDVVVRGRVALDLVALVILLGRADLDLVAEAARLGGDRAVQQAQLQRHRRGGLPVLDADTALEVQAGDLVGGRLVLRFEEDVGLGRERERGLERGANRSFLAFGVDLVDVAVSRLALQRARRKAVDLEAHHRRLDARAVADLDAGGDKPRADEHVRDGEHAIHRGKPRGDRRLRALERIVLIQVDVIGARQVRVGVGNANGEDRRLAALDAARARERRIRHRHDRLRDIDVQRRVDRRARIEGLRRRVVQLRLEDDAVRQIARPHVRGKRIDVHRSGSLATSRNRDRRLALQVDVRVVVLGDAEVLPGIGGGVVLDGRLKRHLHIGREGLGEVDLEDRLVGGEVTVGDDRAVRTIGEGDGHERRRRRDHLHRARHEVGEELLGHVIDIRRRRGEVDVGHGTRGVTREDLEGNGSRRRRDADAPNLVLVAEDVLLFSHAQHVSTGDDLRDGGILGPHIEVDRTGIATGDDDGGIDRGRGSKPRSNLAPHALLFVGIVRIQINRLDVDRGIGEVPRPIRRRGLQPRGLLDVRERQGALVAVHVLKLPGLEFSSAATVLQIVLAGNRGIDLDRAVTPGVRELDRKRQIARLDRVLEDEVREVVLVGILLGTGRGRIAVKFRVLQLAAHPDAQLRKIGRGQKFTARSAHIGERPGLRILEAADDLHVVPIQEADLDLEDIAHGQRLGLGGAKVTAHRLGVLVRLNRPNVTRTARDIGQGAREHRQRCRENPQLLVFLHVRFLFVNLSYFVFRAAFFSAASFKIRLRMVARALACAASMSFPAWARLALSSFQPGYFAGFASSSDSTCASVAPAPSAAFARARMRSALANNGCCRRAMLAWASREPFRAARYAESFVRSAEPDSPFPQPVNAVKKTKAATESIGATTRLAKFLINCSCLLRVHSSEATRYSIMPPPAGARGKSFRRLTSTD